MPGRPWLLEEIANADRFKLSSLIFMFLFIGLLLLWGRTLLPLLVSVPGILGLVHNVQSTPIPFIIPTMPPIVH